MTVDVAVAFLFGVVVGISLVITTVQMVFGELVVRVDLREHDAEE